MNIKYIKAYNQLKKLGCSVYEHSSDQGNFSIDCTEGGMMHSPLPDEVWGMYYGPDDLPYMSPKLDQVLTPLGLFAEWVNPERISIFLA